MTTATAPVGFRDWSYERALEFFDAWDENEQHMGEQAALAVACEQFGVSYMDAEWVDVLEALELFERTNNVENPRITS